MRKFSIVAVVVIVLAGFTLAFAEGNVENGKKLYNDPTLGGSTNPKSCNTCHPGGRGIEHSGTKKYSSLMGMSAGSLEDVVNICIARPLGGKALANDSQQMQDIVAYIKSLKK